MPDPTARLVALRYDVFVARPATLVGVAARLTGLHERAESAESVLEVLAAAGTGALLGFRMDGWRSAVSLGLAGVGILAVVGGPVPITNGQRALSIWGSPAVILGLAGIVHTLLLRVADRPRPAHAAG